MKILVFTLQAESQKLVTTPEVQAKDVPDSVNQSDKLEVSLSSCFNEVLIPSFPKLGDTLFVRNRQEGSNFTN